MLYVMSLTVSIEICYIECVGTDNTIVKGNRMNMKTGIGIATIFVAILGIVSMALVATAMIKTYGLPFVTTSEPVVIQQPAIQTGQQSVIECIDGKVHIDGISKGKQVTINWASPVINQPDMTKTLYCLWDTNVKVSGTIHVNPNDRIQIR